MIYIGVDPGQKGGFAIIDDRSVCVFPWDDRDFIEKMNLVRMVEDSRKVAAVEKVGAMPKQGVTSTFSFGRSYGFIQGVLAAFDIPYQLVPPAVWKREFGLLNADKRGSVDTCKRLFPGINLMATERSRKESDGMAEAALISEYARRKF